MKKYLLILAALCLYSACYGELVTLGFESIDTSSTDLLTDQYQGRGALFEMYQSSVVVVFRGASSTTPASGSTSIYMVNDNDHSAPSQFTLRFVEPGTTTQAFSDFVAFTPTDASIRDTYFSMTAYDINDQALGMIDRYVADTARYLPAEDPELSISSAATNIAYVVFYAEGTNPGSAVIEGDNIRFNQIIPEPSSLALLACSAFALIFRRFRI